MSLVVFCNKTIFFVLIGDSKIKTELNLVFFLINVALNLILKPIYFWKAILKISVYTVCPPIEFQRKKKY